MPSLEMYSVDVMKNINRICFSGHWAADPLEVKDVIEAGLTDKPKVLPNPFSLLMFISVSCFPVFSP